MGEAGVYAEGQTLDDLRTCVALARIYLLAMRLTGVEWVASLGQPYPLIEEAVGRARQVLWPPEATPPGAAAGPGR